MDPLITKARVPTDWTRGLILYVCVCVNVCVRVSIKVREGGHRMTWARCTEMVISLIIVPNETFKNCLCSRPFDDIRYDTLQSEISVR